MLFTVLMIWGEEICISDLLEFMAKSKIRYKCLKFGTKILSPISLRYKIHIFLYLSH